MKNKAKLNMKNFSNMYTFFTVFLFFNSTVLAQGEPTATTGEEIVSGILTEITTILFVIGGLVCMGKLVHIGILYMMSSALEKSNAKTAVLPWLLGTIVCFGAPWIGPLIIDIFRVDTTGGVLSSY